VAVVDGTKTSLRILHVLRAPVGGLFRHVVDLVRGQSERGHQVGVIADSGTGGSRADEVLRELAGSLALGATRIPMPRHLGFSDIAAVREVSRQIARAAPDVVHGHGAKGAAYARLAHTAKGAVRAYTPHGGSLHYGASPVGLLYLTLERLLMRRTDLLLFESEFGRDAYRAKVGLSDALVRVIHNGIAEPEFEPVAQTRDATDLVFAGELRRLKGVDVLIEALIALGRDGRAVSLTVVGDGPDRAAFERQATPLGERVRFVGALPARQGFTMGRMLVVPSRAESQPYIVLEAAGAGMPIIATQVGGIPEIFGPYASLLIPPGDPSALSAAIVTALDHPEQTERQAEMLRQRVRSEFSLNAMLDQGLEAYRHALAARGLLARAAPGAT
jgi:glycosyltransferase involved in cell wall biosynthesis